MSTTKLFARYEAIMRAYEEALVGRDPETAETDELLPTIYARVPHVTDAEIAAALKWDLRRLRIEYDGQKDLARSITEGFRCIRERVARGGPGWQRKN